jgi:hypothetical protein
VPYNPYLLYLFNCHINVEACGSIKADKYLFKYIYKGHDRASVAMRETNKDDNKGNVDEIKQYRDQAIMKGSLQQYWYFVSPAMCLDCERNTRRQCQRTTGAIINPPSWWSRWSS